MPFEDATLTGEQGLKIIDNKKAERQGNTSGQHINTYRTKEEVLVLIRTDDLSRNS